MPSVSAAPLAPRYDLLAYHGSPADGGRAITQDDALAQKIARCRSTNQPTVPLQFTESGYNAGTGEEPGLHPTSEWMQARGVPRLYLEAFRHGLHRLFVYGLDMRHDRGFSLLREDGTPRPAFHALRDLIALLDHGRGPVEPASLALEVDCAVATVHHLLLRRADGAFVLCLWNDVDGWDEAAGRDLAPPEVPATLRFATAPGSIVQFRPCSDGTAALAIADAPGAELAVTVPDHPLLVVIHP
jgi:hypothetical protein